MLFRIKQPFHLLKVHQINAFRFNKNTPFPGEGANHMGACHFPKIANSFSAKEIQMQFKRKKREFRKPGLAGQSCWL